MVNTREAAASRKLKQDNSYMTVIRIDDPVYSKLERYTTFFDFPMALVVERALKNFLYKTENAEKYKASFSGELKKRQKLCILIDNTLYSDLVNYCDGVVRMRNQVIDQAIDNYISPWLNMYDERQKRMLH